MYWIMVSRFGHKVRPEEGEKCTGSWYPALTTRFGQRRVRNVLDHGIPRFETRNSRADSSLAAIEELDLFVDDLTAKRRAKAATSPFCSGEPLPIRKIT
jgi:hypothetical protein